MSDKLLESELPFMALSDVEIVSIFGHNKDQHNFFFVLYIITCCIVFNFFYFYGHMSVWFFSTFVSITILC